MEPPLARVDHPARAADGREEVGAAQVHRHDGVEVGRRRVERGACAGQGRRSSPPRRTALAPPVRRLTASASAMSSASASTACPSAAIAATASSSRPARRAAQTTCAPCDASAIGRAEPDARGGTGHQPHACRRAARTGVGAVSLAKPKLLLDFGFSYFKDEAKGPPTGSFNICFRFVQIVFSRTASRKSCPVKVRPLINIVPSISPLPAGFK